MTTKVNDEDTILEGKMDFVKVKAQTWERDSNGLFDYDSTKVLVHNVNFIKTSFVKRTKDNFVRVYP
jgi:hypothetical protein